MHAVQDSTKFTISMHVKADNGRQLIMQRKSDLAKILDDNPERVESKPMIGHHLNDKYQQIQLDGIIVDDYLLCVNCHDVINSPSSRGMTRMRRHTQICQGIAKVKKCRADPPQSKEESQSQNDTIQTTSTKLQSDFTADHFYQVNLESQCIELDGIKYKHYLSLDDDFVYINNAGRHIIYKKERQVNTFIPIGFDNEAEFQSALADHSDYCKH